MAVESGSPVQGELAAARPTEGLDAMRHCPVTGCKAGFTTPPPLRGTSPYTGEPSAAAAGQWYENHSLFTGPQAGE